MKFVLIIALKVLGIILIFVGMFYSFKAGCHADWKTGISSDAQYAISKTYSGYSGWLFLAGVTMLSVVTVSKKKRHLLLELLFYIVRFIFIYITVILFSIWFQHEGVRVCALF